MATAVVNFRLDSELKNTLEKFCDDVGLTISSLFTIFAKRVAREHKIPFEIENDPFYSEENMNWIRESVKQIAEGKVVVKTMEELEKMANE